MTVILMIFLVLMKIILNVVHAIHIDLSKHLSNKFTAANFLSIQTGQIL